MELVQGASGLFDGRFRIEKLLGRGGMGQVYAAFDTERGEQCALKLLTSRSDSLRFKREFRAITRLHHPNCVSVHHLGQCDSQWYFSMEYVRGGSISQNAWARVEDVMAVALQVLACLDHIHARQIVHRDIKPQNILVDAPVDEEHLHIKVTDFGIARIGGMEEQLAVGTIMGSLPYLSPEQVEEGVVDPRSDLYSLGIVLYQMLCGRHPYGGGGLTGQQWLQLHRHAQPLALDTVQPGVPPEVARVVMRLLEKDPSNRYVTAAMVHDEIAEWLRGTATTMLEEAPPLSRSSYLASPAFVGRGHEVQRLEEFLGGVARRPSQPFVLELEGGAGAGKSRLASQLFRMCDALDMRLVLASCRPEPSAVFEPLAMLLDLLGFRDLREQHPGAETTVSAAPALIARLEDSPTTSPATKAERPASSSRHPGSFPPSSHLHPSIEQRKGRLWELQRRIADELLATARDGALVILLEDVQWADAATLEFVGFLVRAVASAQRSGSGAGVGVAFVLTHRPVVKETVLAEVIAALDKEGLLQRIAVGHLDTGDSAQLVASMLMTELGPEVRSFTERLLKHTSGNPLSLSQSLHALLAGGHLRYGPQGWNLSDVELKDETVPANLQDAIGDRAARLAATTQHILAVAAVLGRRFGLDVIQEVVGLDQDAVLDYLDEAIRAGFVHEVVESHEFVHDGFREAIERKLSPEAKAALHRQVASILEQRVSNRPESAADLAHHLAAAGRYGPAVLYAQRAARFALDSYAFARGADLYEQASSLASEHGIAIADELLAEQGDACLYAGRYDRAAEIFQRLLEVQTQPRPRLDLLRKLAEVEFARGDTRAAISLLEEAVPQAGHRVPSSRLGVYLALLWEMLVLLFLYLFPGLMRRAPRRRSARREVIVRLCTRLAEAYYRWDLPRCLYFQTKALNMAARLGPSKELAIAAGQQGIAFGSHGFYRVGFHYLDLARQIAEEAAGPVERSWVAVLRSMNHAYTGDPHSHDSEGRRGTELLKDSAEPLRLRQALTVWDEGIIVLGRLHQAKRVGKRALQLAEDLQDDRGRGWGLYLLGHVAAREADYGTAATCLSEAYDLLFVREHDLAYGLTAGARLGLVHALRGETEAAVRLSLKVASEMARRRLRHMSCPADGVFLAAAALRLRETGALDDELRLAVRRALRRRSVAECLKYTLPLFLAGEAAWQIATGRQQEGLAGLQRAVEAAKRHGVVGELYDVHCLAAAILPSSHPAHSGYALGAERLRERSMRPTIGESLPAEEST